MYSVDLFQYVYFNVQGSLRYRTCLVQVVVSRIAITMINRNRAPVAIPELWFFLTIGNELRVCGESLELERTARTITPQHP